MSEVAAEVAALRSRPAAGLARRLRVLAVWSTATQAAPAACAICSHISTTFCRSLMLSAGCGDAVQPSPVK